MIIFITGATSGFGKAIAEKFAAAQYNCIITGRREERLLQVAEQLRSAYGVQVLPLVFDVQNREAVFNALDHLPEQWKAIDILVNNAGLALGRDSFDKANMDDWDTMIDTNIKGLLYVTKGVLPYLTTNTAGKKHIINLGSVAGKEVYQNGNTYCATKFAVDALSKSMRIDLLSQGIKVTAVHPGAADTEFAIVRYKGDEEKAAQTYTGYEPLHAHDVADIIYYCASLPSHVCINDLVVTCRAQADGIYFYK